MDSYELNEQRKNTAIENGKRSIARNAQIYYHTNQEPTENVNAMYSVDKQSNESNPSCKEFERASENGRQSKPSKTKRTKVKFTKKPSKTPGQLKANLNYFTQQGK